MTTWGSLVPNVISPEEREKLSEDIRSKLERYLETTFETQTALCTAWQVKQDDYEQKIANQEREILKLIQENEIESEKHNVTKATLKEAEVRIEGLKGDVASLRESVRRLDGEGEELRSQRDAALQENARLRGTLSLNEVEIKTLQEKCKGLHTELQQATNAKYEALAKYQEVKDLETLLQTRENEMEYKAQTLHKQIQDLKDDLNKQHDDLSAARRNYIEQLMGIEAQLTSKTEESVIQKNTIEDLRSSLESSQRKVQELTDKLEEQLRHEARLKESFDRELDALNKLVHVYKSSSSVAEMSVDEVTHGARQLNDLLKESAESYGSLEEKFVQCEAAYKKQILEKDSRIMGLEKELDTANSLLSEMKKEDMSRVIEGLSPAATAACRMLRRCGTITQFYSRFVSVSEELEAIKEENRRLKIGLNTIAEELDEKAPILKKQKEDCERAMTTIVQQSQQMDALNAEMVRVREEEVGLKKQLSHHKQENTRLHSQVKDLAKQVCHLLREVEHARAGISSSGWNISESGTRSAEVISQNLVVFSNMEELQAQNQKLLALVREMSIKEEKAEEMEEDEVALKEKVQFYEVQFKDMQDAAEGHKKLIEMLGRQRDMYRTMYEKLAQGAPAGGAALPQEPSQDNPVLQEMKKKLADTEEQLKKLQEETDSYHKERQINDKMMTEKIQKLTADLDKANDEVAKLTGKLGKYEERFKLQESSVRAYKQQISALEGKALLLSNSLKKYEDNSTYFQNKALQSEGKIASLEVKLERAKSDHSLLVGKESRLRGEYDTLRKEHDKLSRYLENLDAIRSSFDRQEMETTLKLQSLLEDSNRECAALRRRLQEVEQQFKEEKASLLPEIELAKTRVEEEKKLSACLREELETARNNIEKKTLEIEELNKKLTEARMSPLVLRNVSEANSLKSRMKELECQLRESQGQVEALQKHLAEAKQQGSTFREMSEQFEKQWKDATDKHSELKEKLDKQVSEARQAEATLRGKVKELTDRMSKLTAGSNQSTAQLSSQLVTAQEELRKVQDERNTLKQELEASEKKVSTLTSSLLEVEQKYSQEVVFHSNDIQAMTRLKEELVSTSSQLVALRMDKQAVEEALSTQKEQSGQEQQEMRAEMARLQERLAELESQNALLHDQLEALSARIPVHKLQGDESASSTGSKTADSSLVEDEIKSPEQLLQIIKFLRKEKNVIASKLSVAQSENARVKVQLESAEKQLEESRRSLVSEKDKVDMSATAVAKQTELLRKMEMLYAVTDSNRILRDEREGLVKQVKEWTEKYEAVAKELEPLRQSSKELATKVDMLTAENTALRGEAARLRQRNNFLVERTSKSSQEDLRRLQQEREMLTKQVATEKEQYQRLLEETRGLRQDKARLEEQAKVAEQQHAEEVRRLTEETNTVQQRTVRLQQELTDSRSQFTKKNEELAVLTEELGVKESALNEIRNKEVAIRKIAKKYKTQYEEQLKSLEDNKKKLEELQAADSLAVESTSLQDIPEETQERLRAEGRQNMEEKIKEAEEQHNAAMKELTDQVSSSQVENETLRKENDQLKSSAQEKDEQTKKVLKSARDKIMVLTDTNKSLSDSYRILGDTNKDLKEKLANLTQKMGEMQKKLETFENPPEEAGAQLESQISKLQEENADLKAEIQQNEEKYLRDTESLNQKISQLQRQLDKQQGSKPSTSSSMTEKPAVDPPTANIKPMAGPSSTASKQSQSQQSVTVAPWPGRGETPFASIRPMSMQSRMVAVLPTQTTSSSSCQQSASQSSGTVLVAPQQLVHTTGPSDTASSSPTSSHTEFMPATSSAGPPAVRQAAVQPTQQVLVAPSASSSAESTQDMEAESVEDMQQPPQMQQQQQQQQQAVALVLPRVEQTISSQCSEQSSVVTASPQQASTNNNTVTTSQAGVKRPREAESDGSSSRETEKLTPMTKRTRTVEGGSQQETVTSAEGSSEVEYQVPTSSQRDQEDDGPIMDSEEDEDGMADGGVVEEPDDGQEFEDEADNGEGFVVEGYEREEQELVDYDESEGPNIDNNAAEQDSNEVEVAAGEDSNEVPNQSSSVGAESDVGQSTGPEASSSDAQKSEDVSSHASQSMQPVRARSVQPLVRQQQQLLLPQGYEDAGDDSIVPSTPTLFVPRRSDGFAEAVSSPQVPQGRFTFSETNQQGGRAGSAQTGSEGMEDVRMDLSHLEDAGTGRSVPTTPLQVSPQDVSAEVSQCTEGDGAPPSVSDESAIPSNIPSILITQDLEELADQDDVQAPEVTDAEEQDAGEAHSMDQEEAEAADGGNGVSSEGEKLVAVEEAEGREAEASEVPSNSGMSQRTPQRGSGTARRSARSMFRRGGRNDRPTPIIWNEPGSTSSRGREKMVRMSMMQAWAAERGTAFPRGAPRARRVRGKPKSVFTNPYHMRF